VARLFILSAVVTCALTACGSDSSQVNADVAHDSGLDGGPDADAAFDLDADASFNDFGLDSDTSAPLIPQRAEYEIGRALSGAEDVRHISVDREGRVHGVGYDSSSPVLVTFEALEPAFLASWVATFPAPRRSYIAEEIAIVVTQERVVDNATPTPPSFVWAFEPGTWEPTGAVRLDNCSPRPGSTDEYKLAGRGSYVAIPCDDWTVRVVDFGPRGEPDLTEFPPVLEGAQRILAVRKSEQTVTIDVQFYESVKRYSLDRFGLLSEATIVTMEPALTARAGFHLEQDQAWVAGTDGTVYQLDLNAISVTTFDFSGTFDATIPGLAIMRAIPSGNRLYLFVGQSAVERIVALDITDASNPTVAGELETSRRAGYDVFPPNIYLLGNGVPTLTIPESTFQ
jgi:hypothetical protein